MQINRHTRFGQNFKCIHHILAVFRTLELKTNPSEVLEADHRISGDWSVLYVVNGRVKDLPGKW